MRVMSMDVGDRRIGMAISDSFGWTAQGIATLERKTLSTDLERIKAIVLEYQPDSIILGLPKNMNGTLGPQGEKVMKFGDSLKGLLPLEISYWDERLSTVSAHRVLIEADVSRQKRKKKVDQLAAVIILQNYLDFMSNKKED